MPILPRSTWEFRLPPKCPLDGIQFVQLRKFAKFKEQMEPMGLGYDLIEEGCRNRKKRMQQ